MTSRKEIYLRALLVLVSVGITLVAGEIGLRLLSGQRSEKPLDYRDTWRPGYPSINTMGPGGFLKEGFHGEVQDGFGGTVSWINNSQGFRSEDDFAVPKPPHTYRILSLGDSFTGGYRVGQHQTFSALTEAALAKENPDSHVEMMVSVIEDPAYGLYFLQEHGLGYQPDLVILGITLANDVQQTFYRLLFELNFDGATGTISGRHEDNKNAELTPEQFKSMRIPAQCVTHDLPSPDSLPRSAVEVYSAKKPQGLRLVQLFSRAKDRFFRDAPQTVVSDSDTYDKPLLWESHGLALFLKNPPPEVSRAYDALFAVLDSYAKKTAAQGVQFMAVLFPQRYQVSPGDWAETKRVYHLKEDCFDLDRPNRLIIEYCTQRGIHCIDPTARFRSASLGNLYLPGNDMHWNTKGHALLAEFLAPEVERVMHSSQNGAPNQPSQRH